ncbi:uncharacterized protein [Nicotiana sylvestris]|uniref:uncharacterized protein n=1 Tax=Nicotiana sylvestris TaxID=4096 RepID=UPI00388C3EE4
MESAFVQDLAPFEDKDPKTGVDADGTWGACCPKELALLLVTGLKLPKGNLPIPPKKDENGQVIVSTDPLDLDDYTDEQAAIITMNAKEKNLLYNGINVEEYEKISSCETSKEIWDKLEVTYKGPNKVIETRINLLVREYELFQMKDGESAEKMFSRFTQGHCSRVSDLDKMSYDELRGDLIAFEKTHLDMQIQQEKKKTVAFKATVAEPEDEEEEKGGEQDENIAMLSQVVTSMIRKNINSKRGKPKFRKGRENNENDGRFYECGKYGHIQVDCSEVKKKLSRNLQKNKSFGAWSDEEESDHEEIANMCFMSKKDDINEELGELGFMANKGVDEEEDSDIERVLNKLRKIQREKKDWALKLEVCEIKRDMLQEEVNELQLQRNGLQKFTSSRTIGDGSGDLNPVVKLTLRNLTIQDPSRLGYLKTSNFVLQEHHKNNRKGKWYLNSACSRHMTYDKQLFKIVTKLYGGTVTLGDKSKGNIIGVGKFPLSSTCDVDEVYLVDELGYNLLSISQLCDNDYEVRFKKHGWFVEDESGKVILSGNRDRNVYTISNIENLGDQICLASMIDDPWVWHRKLGHASMHTIQKLSKHDLVIGLPKLDFQKIIFVMHVN